MMKKTTTRTYTNPAIKVPFFDFVESIAERGFIHHLITLRNRLHSA